MRVIIISNYKYFRVIAKKCTAKIKKKSGKIKFCRFIDMEKLRIIFYLRFAWAAASLAMGTRNGEQLT